LLKDPGGVDGWAGPYLKDTKSLNDPWGQPIVYVLESDGRTFHVESQGPGGKAGGHPIRSPAALGP